MANEYILKVAMLQSAEDIGCKQEDFLSNENVIVPFKLGEMLRNII